MNTSDAERVEGEGRGPTGTASSLARVVRRYWLLVLLTAIAAAAAAVGLSRLQGERYEATALLQFRPLGPEFQILGVRYVPSANDEAAQAEADAVFVSAREVAERSARRTDPPLTADQVQGRVSVTRQGSTRLVAITASGGSATAAATLANHYARAARALRRIDEARRARSARRALARRYADLTPSRRRGDTGDALRGQIEELDALERIGTGSPVLLEEARPPGEPVEPKTRRNALLGGLFGLLLGAAIAAVREQSDRRLRDRRQLETAFDMRVLAEIPRARGLRKRRRFTDLPPSVTEAFQLLQANLRYAGEDRTRHRVMLTSAAPDEGKSTVAWNLGAAGVAAGLRVLVVEADLRRPELARRYGLDPVPGLAEVLCGAAEPAAAVRPVSTSASSNGASPRTMNVLVAGAVPAHPTELFQSPRLPGVLDEVGREHDLVLIDAPPLPTADAVPLAGLADGVVIVTYVGHATDEEAVQLREQLASLGPRVLGVVANGMR